MDQKLAVTLDEVDAKSVFAYANALELSVSIMAKISDAKIGTKGLDVVAINNGIIADMLLNGGVK